MTGTTRLDRFIRALPYLFLTPIAGILLALAGQELARRQAPPSPAAEAYLMLDAVGAVSTSSTI